MPDPAVKQTVLSVIRVLELYENFPCSPGREWNDYAIHEGSLI